MIRIGPYMTAEEFGAETAVYDRHNAMVGIIRWYPRWRRHVLDPNQGAVFSEDCLSALSAHMRQLDHKRNHGPTPRESR